VEHPEHSLEQLDKNWLTSLEERASEREREHVKRTQINTMRESKAEHILHRIYGGETL